MVGGHRGTNLPIPKALRRKKSLLSINNQDQKCFLYSVLAGILDENEYKYKHLAATDPYKYYPHINDLNMTGISYPVAIKDLPRIERLNPQLTLNVLGMLYSVHNIGTKPANIYFTI